MLNMGRNELAEASSVSLRSIVDFENGQRNPHKSTLVLLRQTLEAAGVEFLAPNGGGPGVRLSKSAPPEKKE